MAIIKVITPSVTDANITTAKVTDNAITLAKMASGTDGNIISYDASGNPVAIATGSDGQVLTSAGAGAQPAFEALPVGGITEADQWRLTTNFAPNSSSSQSIQSGFERADTDGAGKIGTGVDISNGTVTFPSTGTWLITFNALVQGVGNYFVAQIFTTTNNSSYSVASQSWSWGDDSQDYHASENKFLFNVSNTTTHKLNFKCYRGGSSSATALIGSTDKNETHFTFIRLGDST